MGDVAAFFAMGGYAGFVWPAYVVTFAVLAGITVDALWRYRKSVLALEQLQKTRRSRR